MVSENIKENGELEFDLPPGVIRVEGGKLEIDASGTGPMTVSDITTTNNAGEKK